MRIEQKKNDRSGIYAKTQREMAYNSNKIEGSTLTPEQTASLFDTTTYDCAYILNTNSMKFHRATPKCSSVAKMSEKNKKESNESRGELIAQGYATRKIKGSKYLQLIETPSGQRQVWNWRNIKHAFVRVLPKRQSWICSGFDGC